SGTPATLTDLASADAIFVLGDVSEDAGIVDLRIKDALKGVPPVTLMAHGVPIADLRLKERMRRRHEILSVAAPYRVDLMRHAGRSLVYAVGQEQTLFSELLEAAKGNQPAAERTSALGLESGQLSEAVDSLKAATNPVIVLAGT